MASEDQDDSQKTEEPTQKRLEDALKKGNVAFSREIGNFLSLLVFAFIVTALAPYLMKRTAHLFSKFLYAAHEFTIEESDSLLNLARLIVIDFASIMALPFILVVAAGLFSALVQNGILFVADPLMPKLSRISPIEGFKRIFSLKSLVEFIKGVLKISIIAIIAYIAVKPKLEQIGGIHLLSALGILAFLGEMAMRVMIGVCIFMFFIAAVDFFYQKFEYIKSLRMSKRDIKDEFKQTEGSPEVKAKLKEIRNQRAQKRMMANVPNADVVITNPTHYAVALKYDLNIAPAPYLVAKGQDNVALKIREVAKEHDVPIVENPPLARTLFSACEIDQEIPIEQYQAVAEVIKYVYQIKGKKIA